MYEGKLVRLRGLRVEDAETCIEWLNDLDTATKMNGGAPWLQSLAAERDWIAQSNGSCFAVETLDGKLIGSCGFFNMNEQSRSCTVGWMIGDKSARGKGYGSDMIRTFLQYLFLRRNLERVELKVFSYNTGAVCLYERLGFVREAVYRAYTYSMGEYHDAYGYSMLKREYLERYHNG